MRKIVFPLLLLLTVYACQRTDFNAPETVVVSGQQIVQQSGTDCHIADTIDRVDCATLELKWPVITQGNATLKQNVAQWAQSHLNGVLIPEIAAQSGQTVSVEVAANKFLDTHQKTEKSAMTGGWTAESAYKVLLNDGFYLTLEITSYTFQGGAHGSPSAAVATFDAHTGKQLTWDDLVTDKNALQSLSEQQFRQTRSELFKPTDGSEPFNFTTDVPFALAQQYGLVPEGIYSHYVPYEVGPYAIGNTQMIVPLSSLGALFKAKTPLQVPGTSEPAIVPEVVTPSAAVAPSPKPETAPKSPVKPATIKKKPVKTATKTAVPAAPTVTYKQNGDIYINKKKIDFDMLRKQLQAELLTYNVIPDKVPMKTVGQTGMGMRAEINSIIAESISGAKWVRKKAALTALNTVVSNKLGMATQIELGTYNASNNFAYISAKPWQANNQPIAYGMTEYADDRMQPWFVDNVIGLLRYERGAWKVLAYTIGVNKPPVEVWTKKFGAPKAVFK